MFISLYWNNITHDDNVRYELKFIVFTTKVNNKGVTTSQWCVIACGYGRMPLWG